MKQINNNAPAAHEKKAARRFSLRGPAPSKRGMYTAAVSAIVVAIVIVFNLIVGNLPSGTLEFDLSGKDLYTVSEKSADYLKKLDKDIEIVVLEQDSAVDKPVSRLLNNYAKLSSHITLKYIDPVIDPTALTTYDAKQNNVVVRCTETNKSKILNLKGLQGVQDGLILGDYDTYYQSGSFKAVSLDAEGQLTSAVNYVTSDTTSKIYTLSGHGEATLGTNAADRLSKGNITTGTLNLLQSGSIPSDCELLLCFNPSSDLADTELTALESYLKGGGHVMLMLDNPDLKNFGALLKVYGLEMASGYVGDDERYIQSLASSYGKYAIYPNLSTDSDITSSLSLITLLIYSRGMTQVTPERSSAVVTPFLTTSGSAFAATDSTHMTNGTFIIGATATETISGSASPSADASASPTDDTAASSADDATEARLTVITCVNLIDDNLTSSISSISNLDIFFNAVAKNLKTADLVSIPAKSLSVTYNTPANPLLWAALFVVIIPIAVLASGVVNWAKRRRR